MNWIQNFVKKIFKIKPAREKEVVIIEPHTYLADVIRNKLWYWGNSAELEQFFKRLRNGMRRKPGSGQQRHRAA